MAAARIGRFATPEARDDYASVYDEALATLPKPAEIRDISTGFGQVRTYRFDDFAGTPIVLLHGRAATSIMWQPNLADLAARHRVYAIDLLGEGGRSVQTAPIRDADDQAVWLDAVLDGLGIETAHLIGHSIGGWLACNLAVRLPERTASLTLLDPASTLAPIPISLILRTIPVALPVISTWAMPRFLRWINGGDNVPADDPVARVIGTNLRLYRAALPPPVVFTDDQLRAINTPTLVLVAGRSVIHNPQRAFERARALIPNVQAELWPDATHSIAGQFAADVDARVLRFLDSLS